MSFQLNYTLDSDPTTPSYFSLSFLHNLLFFCRIHSLFSGFFILFPGIAVSFAENLLIAMEHLRDEKASDRSPMLLPAVYTAYDPSASAPLTPSPLRNVGKKREAKRGRKARDPYLERVVGRTRLVIRVFSLLFTASIMIVLGYAIAKYLKTQHMSVTDDRSGFKMGVWPSGLKSQPTLVLLGVSATATFLNLVLCTASFSSTVSALHLPRTIFSPPNLPAPPTPHWLLPHNSSSAFPA